MYIYAFLFIAFILVMNINDGAVDGHAHVVYTRQYNKKNQKVRSQ